LDPSPQTQPPFNRIQCPQGQSGQRTPLKKQGLTETTSEKADEPQVRGDQSLKYYYVALIGGLIADMYGKLGSGRTCLEEKRLNQRDADNPKVVVHIGYASGYSNC